MSGTIDSIIRRDAVTLTPDLPLRDAAAAMVSARVSGAPVIDGSGALVGILTQKDCFAAALKASYYRQWSGTVADSMTASPRTLDADTDLVTAAQAFLDHPHRLFPVTENGRLVGVLHRSDLLAAFLALS